MMRSELTRWLRVAPSPQFVPMGYCVGLIPDPVLDVVIRMIQQVERLHLNRDVVPLGEVECSGDPQIHFVDQGAIKGIQIQVKTRPGAGNAPNANARRRNEGTVIEVVVLATDAAATIEVRTGTNL